MTKDLAKNAMLISANVINGGLLGERRDATATELVENTFFVTQRRTKTSKWLIDRKHKSVRRCVASAQRIREIIWHHTMPWGHDKMRLVPVKIHAELAGKLETAIADLKDAWDEFIIAYPSLVAASERELGGLFDRSQYPSADRARTLFKVSINYWPLPDPGQFLAEIAKDAADEAKAAIGLEIETRLLEGSQDMLRRARETIETMVSKLEKYVPVFEGKVEGVFRDSLIDNVRDMAGLIEKLNLTDNREINEIATKMLRLSAHSAQALRDRTSLRVNAVQSGKELLAKLDNLDLRDKEVNDILAGVSDYLED